LKSIAALNKRVILFLSSSLFTFFDLTSVLGYLNKVDLPLSLTICPS
jgi:hypothetical protein